MPVKIKSKSTVVKVEKLV